MSTSSLRLLRLVALLANQRWPAVSAITAVSTPPSTPNLILFITDDQDKVLGSVNFMPKLGRLLLDHGVDFSNAFVTTPICCPSRSSLLTGLYAHNHFVHTNSANCSGTNWRLLFEPRTFGVQLRKAGYRTAYFGKYLNEYTADYIPPGWDDWVALRKNSRYYNYTLNVNGQLRYHGHEYARDYLTDLLANEAVRFLHEMKRDYPEQPFLLVLSFPAPHGTEDSAPQYQDMFSDDIYRTHRTFAWNHAPSPDKEWLLRQAVPMTPLFQDFTDVLHRKRLQTLLSVDDALEKVFDELQNLDYLEHTYMIYTSDNGYHLGQFGMVKGKALPYDFDIRVPFIMRGPGIQGKTSVSGIVLNLDVAPTLLDLAGLPPQADMDGTSVMPLLRGHARWRHHFVVERDKALVGDGTGRDAADPAGSATRHKLRRRRKRRLRHSGRMISVPPVAEVGTEVDEESAWRQGENGGTKQERLRQECRSPQLRLPCRPGQWWYCIWDPDGQDVRKRKCRLNHSQSRLVRSVDLMGEEEVEESVPVPRKMKKRERRKLRNKDVFCKKPFMACFLHDRSHWRTPPLWNGPPVCFCQNSNNNTFYCLRTLNTTHNSLYCEYVTGHISFYDLNLDPYQLTNRISELSAPIRTQLKGLLTRLRQCKGLFECNITSGGAANQ